jgi:hypothetical protein
MADRVKRARAAAAPLIPVPKVMLPAAAGLVSIVGQWVATGVFSRIQLAQLVLTAGYAAIGWIAPRSN